ncbi:hypothetical protein [Pelomicrobium sp.]|uniref:hypothetical protein n=1 Tax=Pelomicrobium sp. TaxID=2815319 RepID=UPI002FDE6C6A
MVAGLVALEPQDLEVGRPTPFRIYGEDGRLILDRGEAIAGKEDRVTLSFTLRVEEASAAIETRAFVRSVNPDPATAGFRLGLQFDRLEGLPYLALKAYVLERLCEDPSSLV